MAKTPELVKRAAADPNRPGEKCQAAPGAWRPVVNHGRCEAKDDCLAVCPHDVFEIAKIRDEDWAKLSLLERLKVWAHGSKTAYVVRPDACKACGLCVVACPEKAVKLVQGLHP